MTNDLFPMKVWESSPGLYELDDARLLSDALPVPEQMQELGLMRGGVTPAQLKEYWQAFLKRLRKLKPVQTLAEQQTIWFPLINLYVPEGGIATISYKKASRVESGPKVRILGSGFGSSLSADVSETASFTAEGTGKSYQMKILASAILYESEDGDQQVRLDPALPKGPPEYRVVDILNPPAPPSIEDSPDWRVIFKVDLTGARQGTYTWQRDKITNATWRVEAGIPLPPSLGFTLNWTVRITRSEEMEVKYILPYGAGYSFYQPSRDTLLAPMVVCM